MNLRKHQKDFAKTIIDIINGSAVKNIICCVTPGGGKSMIPIQAGKLITAGLADGLCWICPRRSLQYQGEKNFVDPFFRKLLNHSLEIRVSTNEINPARGANGFITTYQAIGADGRQTVLTEIRSKRYILVLDEYHHSEADDGSWTKALYPIYEAAKYRVLMSGTLSRGDQKKIAFTPYKKEAGGFIPDLKNSEDTIIIEYTRKQALAENAILPINIIFSDGVATWKTRSGKIVESKISTDDDKKSGHALYTALKTEYAKELLTLAVSHWQEYKKDHQRSKLLVISAGIKHAKEYSAYLKGMGVNARIATSDDGPDAIKAINEFKNGHIDVLSTVNICYEGLDVPAITHIACLTNIRSTPWLEQALARAVRVDYQSGPYETQQAYVFAPKDKMFLAVKEEIEKEQLPAIELRNSSRASAREKGEDGGGFRLEPAPSGITPLSSTLTGKREVLLKCAKNPVMGNPITEQIQTSSEKEADLLGQIESHIRQFAYQNRYSPKRINSEVCNHFGGKKRRQMTIPELERCLKHVVQTYPLLFVRGTGHARVSSKATPINCTWR